MTSKIKRGGAIKTHVANPIKDQGASKRRTRELADRAQPSPPRTPARGTITGKGGATRKGGSQPDTGHPSQRGGWRADPSPIERPQRGRVRQRPLTRRVKG